VRKRPDLLNSMLFATQGRAVVALSAVLSAVAVMVLLFLCVPLPVVQRRRWKAVELPEVGEASVESEDEYEAASTETSTKEHQPKTLGEATQWNWDDANWQGCLAEAVLRKQTFGTPKRKLRKLPDLPAPEHRLRAVGASYVVPIGWAPAAVAKNATGTTLSFGIPALPAVWPLRAVLTRPNPQSAWTKIDLCMDVIAAAELPPLLSCMVCAPFGEVHQQCSQTTGGTGSTVPCSQWLAIRNSGGAILASVIQKEKDPTKCVLQRQSQDRVSWDVDMRLDEKKPSVVISQLGQEVGLATSLGNCTSRLPSENSDASDDEEDTQQHFQFDTHPETQTPDSLLLLTCFLGMLSFHPTALLQKQ